MSQINVKFGIKARVRWLTGVPDCPLLTLPQTAIGGIAFQKSHQYFRIRDSLF